MRRPVDIFLVALCLSALCAWAVLAQTTGPAAESASKEACLKCHGPYEKLAGAPVLYALQSGEKINPHVYVPHAAREAKSIPECGNCHQPHAIPPNKARIKGQPKADVQWCYTACHHNNDFEPCKNCHKQAQVSRSWQSALSGPLCMGG